jgi:hypothetical protein
MWLEPASEVPITYEVNYGGWFLHTIHDLGWDSPGFVDTPKGKGIIPWEVCHGGRTKEVHEGIQG